MTLKGIPDFHNILTSEGWLSLNNVTIDTFIFTLFNDPADWGKLKRTIEYSKPKIFSKYHFKGPIHEYTISQASVQDLAELNKSEFYLKSYKSNFSTLLKTHKVINTDKVLWEGSLINLNFHRPVNIAISNGEDYFLLNTNQ